MDVLIRFGFSIDDIKNMIDANDEINDVDDKIINELISILENIGCSTKHIKNIFITNPFYLTRNVDEVKSLIMKLADIGLVNLKLIFESNPYILNANYKEIDDIYKEKVKEGLSDEEIRNFFYSNSQMII